MCANINLSAQTNHLEIKVEAVDKAFAENPGDALTVVVQGDYPAYTIMLFKKEPWKGAEAIEMIKNSMESSHTFKNLKAGVYHVCVLDAKENMVCKKVKVTRR